VDVQALDAILDDAVAADDVPGVVAVAGADGPIYAHAAGRCRIDQDASITIDPGVPHRHMTTPVTAVAALQLRMIGLYGAFERGVYATLPGLRARPALSRS
jgi:hypothetical protein